jgi:hypothetical protein
MATGGLRVVPDVALEICPPLDILVAPAVMRSGDVHVRR